MYNCGNVNFDMGDNIEFLDSF